jgi:hypothetical protein
MTKNLDNERAAFSAWARSKRVADNDFHFYIWEAALASTATSDPAAALHESQVRALAATVQRRIDACGVAANTPDADYFDASTNLIIAARELLSALGGQPADATPLDEDASKSAGPDGQPLSDGRIWEIAADVWRRRRVLTDREFERQFAHEVIAAALHEIRVALTAEKAWESGEPVAWESTTPVYHRFITDTRYQALRPETRKWYKPYLCPHCVAPQQPTQSADQADAPTEGYAFKCDGKLWVVTDPAVAMKWQDQGFLVTAVDALTRDAGDANPDEPLSRISQTEVDALIAEHSEWTPQGSAILGSQRRLFAKALLDLVTAQLCKEDAATVAYPRYIVIGYGETDHPQAAFVNEREQLLDAVLGMMYTSPSDACDDTREEYRKDLADDDEWSHEGIWRTEFEIGGVVIYDLGEPAHQDDSGKTIGEDAANGAIGEREAFLTWWCADVPEHMREKWKESVDECLRNNHAQDKLVGAWDGFQFGLTVARAALTAEKVAAEPIRTHPCKCGVCAECNWAMSHE